MSNLEVQLALYNEALELCGERPLASLSESREPRRHLDRIWDTNVRDTCLELGQWNFAARISALTYSPSITPPFGHQYGFDKPTDLVVLMKLCSDELLQIPLLRYQDAGPYWFCDLDTVYLQYVSNDDSYGNDFSLWPESFKRYVAAYMAGRLAPRLSRDKATIAHLIGEARDRLTIAKNKDAMKEPTKFMPKGDWARARGGNRRRFDRA